MKLSQKSGGSSAEKRKQKCVDKAQWIWYHRKASQRSAVRTLKIKQHKTNEKEPVILLNLFIHVSKNLRAAKALK